ncbi:sigma 54-interacting transcriptional regulator [Pseudonocardia parietis]|uniref:Sigma-54 factor interaction domain-containing protein n=1 Tax=Pseudonocardia parietis TaxID=570936 RepID=A0ABS4VTW9_9PSEU|nr:sigma 54-interacting transcriptional regulator [Pseudonocardia parietis]MBP2367385.1 hypothetical protein [Pseudonocardia parietis]
MTAINEGGEVLGVLVQIRPCGDRRPHHARSAASTGEHTPDLIGAPLRSAFRTGRDAAEHSIVLISGEQGVGKTTLARSIHLASPRGSCHRVTPLPSPDAPSTPAGPSAEQHPKHGPDSADRIEA